MIKSVFLCKYFRVPSLEQLSLAEFSAKGQRSMKTAIIMFLGFRGIEAQRFCKFAKIRVFKVDYFDFSCKKFE